MTRDLIRDVAGLHNRHAHMLFFSVGSLLLEFDPPPPHVLISTVFGNALKGETCGGEMSVSQTEVPSPVFPKASAGF